MKRLLLLIPNALLIVLTFNAFAVNAQSKIKADSAYYLLDTSKTQPSDRLWRTYQEGNAKFYKLDIAAIDNLLMDKPTFAYSHSFQQPSILNQAQLKSIKVSTLSELISILNQFAKNDTTMRKGDKKPFYLYIIE